jgi:hypothetical protein
MTTKTAKSPASLMNMEYLAKLPLSVPEGKILVHNNVYPVARQVGTRGSRGWLSPTSDTTRYEVCGCGWAAELGQHYCPPKLRA